MAEAKQAYHKRDPKRRRIIFEGWRWRWRPDARGARTNG
jgi:hypothetical protein